MKERGDQTMSDKNGHPQFNRERRCFGCGTKLHFLHFQMTNTGRYHKELIKRLWNSESLEFLCCFCYSSRLKRQIMTIKTGDNIRKCCVCDKKVKFEDYIKYDEDSMEKTVFKWNPQEPGYKSNRKEGFNRDLKDIAPNIYCEECYMERKRAKFYETYGNDINKYLNTICEQERPFLNDFISQNFYFLPKLEKYCRHNNGFTIKHNHIMSLNLSRIENLRIPRSIGKLSHLKLLDLTFNKLREIPSSMGNIKSLEILKLGYNKLRKIPHSFRNLKNLRQLFLPMNILEEVPSEIEWLSQLTHLDISYNPIRKIPNFFENLRNLKIVYCMGFRKRKDICLDDLYELKKSGVLLVT